MGLSKQWLPNSVAFSFEESLLRSRDAATTGGFKGEWDQMIACVTAPRPYVRRSPAN